MILDFSQSKFGISMVLLIGDMQYADIIIGLGIVELIIRYVVREH